MHVSLGKAWEGWGEGLGKVFHDGAPPGLNYFSMTELHHGDGAPSWFKRLNYFSVMEFRHG